MTALTHGPLPTWSNLVAALVNSALPDGKLAAPWCRTGDRALWFSRSTWSLLAIAQWRQRLTGLASITVWLPDFFCNASLIPLRSMGAKLLFYPLTEHMAPDLDALRDSAHQQRPDLVVLAHFFGQPAPAADAVALCRRTGAWLIEDAAHGLRPIQGIGEQGDCVLYSPYKHLPIPDGAVLVVRENGPARLAWQESALRPLGDVYRSLIDSPGFSHLPAALWLTKRTLQRLGLRAWRRPVIPFLTDPASPRLAHPKMSPLARRLLSYQLDSFDTVAHLRQQHLLLWEQALTRPDTARLLVTPTPADGTPYLAGFANPDAAKAESLYLWLQRAGLPVTTWPDLPPEVSGEHGRHAGALKMRRTRFYLPVHQTLEPRDISGCRQRLLEREVS